MTTRSPMIFDSTLGIFRKAGEGDEMLSKGGYLLGNDLSDLVVITSSGTSLTAAGALTLRDSLVVSGTAEITGHMAVGNDADLDFPGFPTYEILLNMNETFGASIAGTYGINLYTYGTADNASAVMRGISANTAHKSSGQFNNIRGVYSAVHTDVDDITGNDMHAIYGSAYIAGNNTTVTNIVGGYFAAGAVFGMVTATGTNVAAGQFRALALGTGDFNVTNTYGVQILTPGATYNGTLTNLYGLYIEDMTASSISFANEYNIYSAGATSKNYFEGDINFDGTVSGTGDIYAGGLTATGIATIGGAGHSIQFTTTSGNIGVSNDTDLIQLDGTTGVTINADLHVSTGWTGSIPTISGTITVVDGIITNYS